MKFKDSRLIDCKPHHKVRIHTNDYLKYSLQTIFRRREYIFWDRFNYKIKQDVERLMSKLDQHKLVCEGVCQSVCVSVCVYVHVDTHTHKEEVW